MNIIKHAQSCFLLETSNSRVLIDPGTYVFQREGLKPSDFNDIDVLIITHEHRDHFDIDAVAEIIQNNSPAIHTTDAVRTLIKERIGYKAGSQPNGIKIEQYISTHGPLPNGNKPPHVAGFVVDDGVDRFYTPGDSKFLDQSVNANIVAVPICGKVVMDIETAKAEVLKLKPDIVIPIHYDNDMYPVKVEDFEKTMQNTGIIVKTLKWGESFETK